MKSLQFLGNLTIVSVFQLIFIQQNYRTVNVYSNRLQNEVYNKIIQTASDSMKPLKLMCMDKVKMRMSAYDELVLNIVVVNDLNDWNKVLNKSCLFDTTVIWLTSENEESDITDIQWFNLSSKVIVLSNSNIYTSNKFVKTKINRLGLTNFNFTLTNRFLADFFSIKSIKDSSVTIFSQFNAPKSEFSRIDEKYLMIGPDGVLAESFVKWLNMKPTFSSSVALKHPHYQHWLNSSTLSPRLRYQYFHSLVLTKNIVTIFNHNLNSTFDIQFTAFPHQGRNFTARINISTEALFAHDTDCLVAIVPHRPASNNFLHKVFNHADTTAISFALILFIVARIFLQKGSWHRGFLISFDTVGIFFNQKTIPNENNVQVAWDVNLRIFSLLATTALSAIIFRSLIAADGNEINTINDLIESNLSIYAPDYLKNQDRWECMMPKLRSKINLITPNDIMHNLVNEQKIDNAYIYHESKSEYIKMIVNAKLKSKGRSSNRVRFMKEHIHCGLASYRVSENSPLTPYANDFILRFLEGGLYNKQLEWMQNLNEAVFQVKGKVSPKKKNVVLTMKMIFAVFIVYLVGIAIATFSFVIEIVHSYIYRLAKQII